MATSNVYLNFSGNTEEAFEFYRSVIGGGFAALMRFSDTPMADQMPEELRGKIMHIALQLDGGTMIMATDALESMGHTLVFGTNTSVCLGASSLEEGHKLFDGLSDGGKVEQKFEKMFWGDYFGNFTDKFGVQWMVTYHEAQPE